MLFMCFMVRALLVVPGTLSVSWAGIGHTKAHFAGPGFALSDTILPECTGGLSRMFTIRHHANDSLARTGELATAHGVVHTPAFVGVATQATIKAVEPQALVDHGMQIVIANTYHLHLRPGEDTVAALGGVHGFSGWSGPTMTDSGGFQVFSLGAGKEHGVGKVASIFPEETPTSARSSTVRSSPSRRSR